MLLKKLLRDKSNFDLNLEIENGLNIYNNKTHSSTKYEPLYLIKSKDKNEWKTAINNIKKIRNRNNKNAKPFDKNQPVLISISFVKKNNKLCIKKFQNKGTYSLPAKII